MGALLSTEEKHGPAADIKLESFTFEDRLHRLELLAKHGEAAAHELRSLQRRVVRLEQSQGEMKQTHETLLLRLGADFDIPAEEDAGDGDIDEFEKIYDQLNYLRAAQRQLGDELVKTHRQETHYVGQYAMLHRRIQKLEEVLSPDPGGAMVGSQSSGANFVSP